VTDSEKLVWAAAFVGAIQQGHSAWVSADKAKLAVDALQSANRHRERDPAVALSPEGQSLGDFLRTRAP
jgi:hypothetical protein